MSYDSVAVVSSSVAVANVAAFADSLPTLGDVVVDTTALGPVVAVVLAGQAWHVFGCAVFVETGSLDVSTAAVVFVDSHGYVSAAVVFALLKGPPLQLHC